MPLFQSKNLNIRALYRIPFPLNVLLFLLHFWDRNKFPSIIRALRNTDESSRNKLLCIICEITYPYQVLRNFSEPLLVLMHNKF